MFVTVPKIRMFKQKLAYCVIILSMVSFIQLLDIKYSGIVKEELSLYEKKLYSEDCFQCMLFDKILEYYKRESWWDFKLCSGKIYDPILSNIDDLLPLETFNKDVEAHDDPSRNIFFFENNCKSTLEFYILCSLESAASQNPDATIFLLTVTPFIKDDSGHIRNLLKSFPNIKILQADYDDILQDTPLDVFTSSDIWTNNTNYVKAHISDLMRVALIWKEGGTYLDSDMISVKKLPPHEHAVIHGRDDISNNFIKSTKRHEYLKIVMNYQKSSYKADIWNSIGPVATTKGINLYCNMTSYRPGTCNDISILPLKSLVPVYWDELGILMERSSDIDPKVFLKNCFGIHTSHNLVRQYLNELGTGSLYDKITKEFCPISYKRRIGKSGTP